MKLSFLILVCVLSAQDPHPAATLRAQVFAGAVIFDAPSILGNRLVKIPTGRTQYVYIYGYAENGYWKVAYQDFVGYLAELNIVKGDPKIDEILEKVAAQREDEEREAEKAARAAALSRKHAEEDAAAERRKKRQAAALAGGKEIAITGVDSRVTEKNETWWRYAWKLTLSNNTTVQKSVNVTIEWTDADGFVIDDDREYGLSLGPGAEQTFTGYDLIDASVAGNVHSVGAKIAWK